MSASRYILIVASVLLIGLTLGWLHASKSPPIYESSARVLIEPVRSGASDAANGRRGQSSARADLTTQRALILSPLIVGLALSEPRPSTATGSSERVADAPIGGAGLRPESSTERANRPLARHPLSRLPSLARAGDPVAEILKNLSVSQEQDSQILVLRYRSKVARDCEAILDAIVSAYCDYLQNEQDSVPQRSVALLRRAERELGRELEHLEEQYARFREENAELLVELRAGEDVSAARMARLEETRDGILVERSRLLGELKAIEQAEESESGDELAVLLIGRHRTVRGRLEVGSLLDELGEIDRQIGVVRGKLEQLEVLASRLQQKTAEAVDEKADIHPELLPLLQEEKQLLRRYGENHPKVVAIRAKIELTRATLAKARREQQLLTWREERLALRSELERLLNQLKSVRQELGLAVGLPPDLTRKLTEIAGHPGRPAEQRKRLVASYAKLLKQRIAELDRQAEHLQEQAKEERRKAKELLNLETSDRTFRNAIERKRQLFDAVVTQLRDLDSVRQADQSGFDATILAAPTAAVQIEPKLARSLAIAAGISLLLGLIIVSVTHTVQKTFSVSADIEDVQVLT